MVHDDENPPDNVINFPRVGFNPGPVIPPPPAPAAPPTPDAAPVVGDDQVEAPARGRRRSPMDVVSELRQPGLDEPVMAAGPDFDLEPGGAGSGEQGVPETFRGAVGDDPGQGEYGGYGAQLGVLAAAAALAVAVAALRGIHSAVSAWRANREQRRAVDRVAAGGSGSGSTSGGRGGGRGVQPGHEFGRKTLNRSHDGKQRNGSGSGGRGGSGGGKPPRTPGSDRKDRTDRKNHGRGGAGGRGHSSDSAKRNNRTSRDKAPGKDRHGKHKPGSGLVHRTTQAGSRALDRARRKHLDKPGNRRNDLAKRPKNHPDRPGHKKNRTPDLSKHRSKKRPGRTTLAAAISEEAARRMNLRRKSMTPPLWSARKDTDRRRTDEKKSPRRTGPAAGYWGRAHAKARDYWQRRHAAHTGGPATDTSTTSTGSTGGTDGGMGAGTFGPRRSGWAGAGMAGETTVTLTRIDDVEDTTHRPEPAGALTAPFAALPAAPVKHFPRPGTRRPRPMPPVPAGPAPSKEHRMSTISRRRTGAVPGMDAQHETEVTLDGAVDLLEDLTANSFATHDQCVKLAARARRLRERLLALAEDLAVTHNVIGQATAGAMAHLAEDMDVLASQAEAMRDESLHAAEATEAADTALNDAYRPITQAAADAGLLAPSAPVHNQT